MAGEKTMMEIIHLYRTVWCLSILLSVSCKPGISKFAGNIINLGINTTPSRKLLTSKLDTKIGQTIVIFSGRRSMGAHEHPIFDKLL